MFDVDQFVKDNMPEDGFFTQEILAAAKSIGAEVLGDLPQDYYVTGGSALTILRPNGKTRKVSKEVRSGFFGTEILETEVQEYDSAGFGTPDINIVWRQHVNWKKGTVTYVPHLISSPSTGDLESELLEAAGITPVVVNMPVLSEHEAFASRWFSAAKTSTGLASYWGSEEAGYAYFFLASAESKIAKLALLLEREGIDLPDFLVGEEESS